METKIAGVSILTGLRMGLLRLLFVLNIVALTACATSKESFQNLAVVPPAASVPLSGSSRPGASSLEFYLDDPAALPILGIDSMIADARHYPAEAEERYYCSEFVRLLNQRNCPAGLLPADYFKLYQNGLISAELTQLLLARSRYLQNNKLDELDEFPLYQQQVADGIIKPRTGKIKPKEAELMVTQNQQRWLQSFAGLYLDDFKLPSKSRMKAPLLEKDRQKLYLKTLSRYYTYRIDGQKIDFSRFIKHEQIRADFSALHRKR